MLDEAFARAKHAPPNSLATAFADWAEAGLFSGVRRSEWAQESTNSTLGSQQLNIYGDTQAFTLPDIRFEALRCQRFIGAGVLQIKVTALRKCWVRFRTQKNGDNGQERLFTRNPKPGGRCFVTAMYRIIERFVRLRSPDDHTTPLSIYSPSPGVVKLITSSDIEALMRAIASAVYKLDPVKDREALQRWSSHSFRVGACVILHSMGFTETQIQWLLRWRSKAFMTYLRNLASLADKQHCAFDEASAMPHFF